MPKTLLCKPCKNTFVIHSFFFVVTFLNSFLSRQVAPDLMEEEHEEDMQALSRALARAQQTCGSILQLNAIARSCKALEQNRDSAANEVRALRRK